MHKYHKFSLRKNIMKQFSQYTCLIFNDEPYYSDGKNYYSVFNWGRIASSLSPYMKKIFYLVPVRQKNSDDSGIEIVSDNMVFIPLPFWRSLATSLVVSLKNFFILNATIKNATKESDIIYLRLPSLIAFIFFFWAKRLHKPVVVYIGGNIITQANPAIEGFLIKRLIAKCITYIIHFFTCFVVRYSLITFAKGDELLQLYKGKHNHQVIPLVTSQISESLILKNRDDTCQKQLVRILRVSRILPSKGYEYLIEAIYLLSKEGYDVQLDIVGKSDSSVYESELKALAGNYRISDKVIFHGYVPFGESLFQLYRNADISVISSISEGSPRTIIETWAFGLPLVATTVGGITDLVKNEENGLLISPKSAEEISMAIKRIINNESLRKKLIKKGLELAEIYTEENQALFMVKTMEQYLLGKNNKES